MEDMIVLACIGDFYHKAEPARKALEKAVECAAAAIAAEGRNGVRVKLLFAESPESFVAKLAERPAAAVLFAENRVSPDTNPERVWMSEQAAEDIVRYVAEGGGLLAWHSGLASYPTESGYISMLKGYFLSHPAEHAIVRYEPAGGYSGTEPFELLDEHYFVACKEAETEVFLRSSSRDGDSVAGWRHEAGKGRVCCLTPAHREEGLADEAFASVLGDTVRWTLRLLQ